MIKGNFIDNLPKIYGIYTGGFIGFILLMAIGEQMGMSAKAIPIAFADIPICSAIAMMIMKPINPPV